MIVVFLLNFMYVFLCICNLSTHPNIIMSGLLRIDGMRYAGESDLFTFYRCLLEIAFDLASVVVLGMRLHMRCMAVQHRNYLDLQLPLLQHSIEHIDYNFRPSVVVRPDNLVRHLMHSHFVHQH